MEVTISTTEIILLARLKYAPSSEKIGLAGPDTAEEALHLVCNEAAFVIRGDHMVGIV